MNPTTCRHPDPCVVPGVQPLLSELRQPVSIRVHTEETPERGQVEQLIRQVFLQRYGARLDSFYPRLLSFRTDEALRAAVGFRDAVNGPLFAEQYLPSPIEALIADHWGQDVRRGQVVEVGNLALAEAGEARWVIAAVTTFLHAQGYRWVLFTAVRSLFNAFQRLGLNPLQLAAADPRQLPDRGRDWGSYYQDGPIVCVGDIRSGHHKLARHVSANQPMLRALLNDACHRASSPWCPAMTLSEGAR